jgi:hypothetical protein
VSRIKLDKEDCGRADAIRRAFDRARSNDDELLNRALGVLHRMATERIGWRCFFSRWYYSDEPLRNDAANLVREAGFGMGMPLDTHLVGDLGKQTEKNSYNSAMEQEHGPDLIRER